MTLIALVHTAGPEPSGPFVTTLADAPVHEDLEINGFAPVVKSFPVWMDWHLGYQTRRDIY